MDAEVRQLRDTVTVLRGQLEEEQEAARQKVRDAEHTSRAELDEYKETIRELRDTLERREAGGA